MYKFLTAAGVAASLLGGSAAWVVGGSAAWAAGDPAKGESVFQGQCAMCHGVTPGAMGIGPTLAAIYNKPAASTAGYEFSSALKNAHLVWNDATLDKFIAAPQSLVPGTKMPYAGLADSAQRADLIAYLAKLGGS